MVSRTIRAALAAAGVIGLLPASPGAAGEYVYVTRFWHLHQPIYWPEWNSNGSQTGRVQYAWDSIVLKSSQTYGTGSGHPENDLEAIFGLDDRKAAYQWRPRDSLQLIDPAGGFQMSYSGSLIDNVRNLGANGQLGYSSSWWDGNRQARTWNTPSGRPRLDLVGFTYHHSLAPLLPKEVFRKELQIFKQAWWKAWNGNMDLSDHSKGFFPTEMAFSPLLIDVLVDEGYEWAVVASHHLSRTCPTYLNYANPTGTYNIYSSPPNRADRLGPSPEYGWWYSEPNPGNAAWNVSPFAYQLHRVKYVDPETGQEKSLIVVPSDDVLSYRYGYANEGISKIQAYIAPFATNPARPVIVMPATDGDNAWGGGYSSWMEATPQFFGDSANAGYHICTVQDFVDQYGSNATLAHVEDGAWIFPEMDYGSPYFLKWIEPPIVNENAGATNRYPGTKVDLETPGFSVKFYNFAPLMAGANWCITAEQIWEDEGGTVETWKIQAPYDWDGSWTGANIVEMAWHIYLCGWDSGFNYYGGLGNDDEVKPSLATRRAIEMLQDYVSARTNQDLTPPTVLRPQRFPWNPGWYTFGWFNSYGSGTNLAYLKKMPSEFYIWTLAYDVSGITSITAKVRLDYDGVNSLSNNDNETYAGGPDVGSWISLPMEKRTLPKDRATLNNYADNADIDFFITSPEIADYYFVRICESNVPGFRGKLLDYYIEAFDGRGNRSRSEIQHVFVEDDGQGGPPPSSVTFSEDPRDCAPLGVTYDAGGGPLSNTTQVVVWISFDEGVVFTNYDMNYLGGGISECTNIPVPDNAPSATVYFENQDGSIRDDNSGQYWSTSIRDCDQPSGPSSVSFSNAPACDPVTVTYFPNAGPLQGATQVFMHLGYNDWQQVIPTQQMSSVTANQWQITVQPPEGAWQIDMVFHDGAGTWDNNSGQDWHFALNECQPPPVPPGVTITGPAADLVVTYDVSNYTLRGTVSDDISGYLCWTNQLTGDDGIASAVNPWVIYQVPLGVGTNLITVVGSNAASTVVTDAWDDASQTVYADGWQTNDNGGTGLGDWTFYTSTNDGDRNGRFIGSNDTIDIGTPAWGLYANQGNLSEAKRWLAQSLDTGATFHVEIDNGYIDSGGSIGIALQNQAGETLWEFYFTGGEQYYTITGGATDIGWTPGGLEIEVMLDTPTTYVSRIRPLGGAIRTNRGDLVSHSDMTVRLFRAWNYTAGSGSDYDLFFNNLRITHNEPSAGGTTSDTVRITRQDGSQDSNGDGISDYWSVRYGYDPHGPDISANDDDGDGFSNLQEYIADTHPKDSAAAFTNRVEIVGFSGDVLELRLQGPTTNSRIYELLVTTNLVEQDWQPDGSASPGDDGGGPLILTATNIHSRGFYRARVSLP